MSSLSARLDAALAEANALALVDLYEEAACAATSAAQKAFFLTHAYVHALECGSARTSALRAQLVAMGCETP